MFCSASTSVRHFCCISHRAPHWRRHGLHVVASPEVPRYREAGANTAHAMSGCAEEAPTHGQDSRLSDPVVGAVGDTRGRQQGQEDGVPYHHPASMEGRISRWLPSGGTGDNDS